MWVCVTVCLVAAVGLRPCVVVAVGVCGCVVVAVGVGGNCIAWLSCCLAVRGMQKMHVCKEGVAKMKNSSATKGQKHKNM